MPKTYLELETMDEVLEVGSEEDDVVVVLLPAHTPGEMDPYKHLQEEEQLL